MAGGGGVVTYSLPELGFEELVNKGFQERRGSQRSKVFP